jgi:hypothetical protein
MMSNRIHYHLWKIGFFLIFSTATLWSQPFAIGHTTIIFIDASRGDRNIATEIYYPADVAGDDVPFTATTTVAFPSVTFGHGFIITWEAYRNIWEALVPNGYIIAFPKTEGGLSPSHTDFAKDLAFVSDQIFNLGMLQSTIFFNRVSVMNAVMGHSMGGGAAFLAPQYNTNIKTIVTLAAAETNPSAIAAANTILLPALVIAGANDCVTPPAANQVAMYNSLLSACKTYVEILGGSHCQMANSNFLCNFGEATCTPSPTITRNEQHLVLEDYLIFWLEAQLKADCTSGSNFNSLINSDSRVTFQKNCLQCEALDTPVLQNRAGIAIYPNPFSSQLNILNSDKKAFNLRIYDSAARILFTIKQTVEQDYLDTTLLTSGIYFYEIIMEDGSTLTGKIIKN